MKYGFARSGGEKKRASVLHTARCLARALRPCSVEIRRKTPLGICVYPYIPAENDYASCEVPRLEYRARPQLARELPHLRAARRAGRRQKTTDSAARSTEVKKQRSAQHTY